MERDLAAAFRSFFSSTQAGSEKNIIQSILSKYEPNIQVQDLSIRDLEALEKPLTLQLGLYHPSRVQTKGEERIGRWPSIWERHFISLEYLPSRTILSSGSTHCVCVPNRHSSYCSDKIERTFGVADRKR